jgi:hypothetical protein
MIAEAYGHPLFPMAPDIVPFEVPAKDYVRVLDYFRNAQLDRELPSPSSQEMGTIRLVLKGPATFRICWFWVREHGRLAFSCNGIRYVCIGEPFSGDEALTVDATLRKISEETHGGRKAKQTGVPDQRAHATEKKEN